MYCVPGARHHSDVAFLHGAPSAFRVNSLPGNTLRFPAGCSIPTGKMSKSKGTAGRRWLLEELLRGVRFGLRAAGLARPPSTGTMNVDAGCDQAVTASNSSCEPDLTDRSGWGSRPLTCLRESCTIAADFEDFITSGSSNARNVLLAFGDDYLELVRAPVRRQGCARASATVPSCCPFEMLRLFAPFLPFVTRRLVGWRDESIHRSAGLDREVLAPCGGAEDTWCGLAVSCDGPFGRSARNRKRVRSRHLSQRPSSVRPANEALLPKGGDLRASGLLQLYTAVSDSLHVDVELGPLRWPRGAPVMSRSIRALDLRCTGRLFPRARRIWLGDVTTSPRLTRSSRAWNHSSIRLCDRRPYGAAERSGSLILSICTPKVLLWRPVQAGHGVGGGSRLRGPMLTRNAPRSIFLQGFPRCSIRGVSSMLAGGSLPSGHSETTLRCSLEKYAVRAGGGTNHRAGLDDGILIKDNHIRLGGGVANVVRKMKAARQEMSIEIEAQSLQQVDEAVAAGADIILVDNLPIEDIREAVRRIAGRAKVELSGGVTLDRIPELARTGADYVSIGR